MATWYGTVSKRCIKAGRAANGKIKDKVAITLRKFSNDLDVSMYGPCRAAFMIKLVITRFLCTLFYIVVESNSEKNV